MHKRVQRGPREGGTCSGLAQPRASTRAATSATLRLLEDSSATSRRSASSVSTWL